MAAEYPVRALILQSPFTSLRDLGQYHYRILPVKWFIKDPFDSVKIARKVHSPTLVLYGEEDEINPPSFTLRLYEALPQPKQLIGIPKKGHNDLFEPDLMIEFIRSLS
jgi:pimeloyl-ACP methyl ester carboxylesterase